MNRFPTIVYGLVILDFQRLFNPQTTYFIPKCLEVPEVDNSIVPGRRAIGLKPHECWSECWHARIATTPVQAFRPNQPALSTGRLGESKGAEIF